MSLRRLLAVAAAAAALPAVAPSPAAAGDELAPAMAIVPSVSYSAQTHALSCESAALEMALTHESIVVSQDVILAAIPVDVRTPADDGSGRRWGNPYTSFVGDVDGSEVDDSGYGTYYPTIAAAARQLGGRVLFAGEGLAPEEVYESLRQGHPVVAWITYDYSTHQRHDYVSFDGASIPYAGPVEHAVTLVGVDSGDLLVFDPDRGQLWIAKPVFESVYATFNQMAVVLA